MSKSNKRALYSKLASYYDFIAPPTTELECRFLNDVFQNYKKSKITRILDLGCGTGRHSCFLSKMGYEVTGIDLANEILKIARKKCPKTKFIKMDFTKPSFSANFFDASICMWTTIAFIKSEENFRRFIETIANITKHLLVLDSPNYENPIRNRPLIKEKNIIKLPKIAIKTSMVRRYDRKTHFRDDSYTYTLIEKGKKPAVFKEKERVRIWFLKELKNLLKPNFRVLEVYGNYDLNKKYSPKISKRKIIVAEKI